MFKTTSHLSQILEDSELDSITIFKYSSKCASSDILKKKIEKNMNDGVIVNPVYIVTVQDFPVLSQKIEEFFDIKHESPQMIVVNNTKAVYSASHSSIELEKLP